MARRNAGGFDAVATARDHHRASDVGWTATEGRRGCRRQHRPRPEPTSEPVAPKMTPSGPEESEPEGPSRTGRGQAKEGRSLESPSGPRRWTPPTRDQPAPRRGPSSSDRASPTTRGPPPPAASQQRSVVQEAISDTASPCPLTARDYISGVQRPVRSAYAADSGHDKVGTNGGLDQFAAARAGGSSQRSNSSSAWPPGNVAEPDHSTALIVRSMRAAPLGRM